MIAVLTVIFVLAASMVVVRVASVALAMTGVSRDLAQFQALSAFTGSGFTTQESEDIVNHPVRRRIVMHLMRLGNAGIVVAIASVLRLVLVAGSGDDWYETFWFRAFVLAGGIAVLWLMATSRWLEAVMWKIIAWAVKHWTRIDVRDYTGLLRLAGDYAVSELRVRPGDWVAGHRLKEIRLPAEGILVLGIERHDGTYLGSPRGETSIGAGDLLILYGRQGMIADLDERGAGFDGNVEHMIAVTRQLDVQMEESDSTSED